MSKETLEEAAERLYPINFSIDYDKNKEERDIWLEGAKWQEERSYNEEDLRTAYNISKNANNFDEWFEKFKKS